jgi:hypothetical protein
VLQGERDKLAHGLRPVPQAVVMPEVVNGLDEFGRHGRYDPFHGGFGVLVLGHAEHTIMIRAPCQVYVVRI